MSFRSIVGQGLAALFLAMLILIAGMASLQTVDQASGQGREKLDPDTLTKYVDLLPRPRVLQPTGRLQGRLYYEVRMTQFQQLAHRDLPPTTLWGYAGSWPGPTIEARPNEKILVTWLNELPAEHLLPVDTSIHGAEPPNPAVRTVVHLHGGDTPGHSDGYPEAWFTKGFAQRGPHWTRRLYAYPNRQEPTTLWYHDHAIGITRLNVYAGLAGFYIIRDSELESRLGLPRGRHEVPLLIQDRSFYEDGGLYYPLTPEDEPGITAPSPSISPEFFADTAVVNGKVWPYLEVEPRKYRFRVLNGCNARTLNLMLVRADADNEPDLGTAGPALIQIGSDGGLLPSPVDLTQGVDPADPTARRLLLMPAERADIVVDFSDYAGQSFILHNNAFTPFQGLDVQTDPANDSQPLPEIMLFRVRARTPADSPDLPAMLADVPRTPESAALITRTFTLEEIQDQFGRSLTLLDGTRWFDVVVDPQQPLEPGQVRATEVRSGSTEIWRMVNLTDDVHPIHIHQGQFQILDRRPFDVDHYNATGEIVYTGPAVPPDPEEIGWKDTFQSPPGHVTRVIDQFEGPSGLFVWHCHILEHEDHEMMLPFQVVPATVQSAP